MPSTTTRWSRNGRPAPVAEGINGSISAHCSSVRASVRVTRPACQRDQPPIRRHTLGGYHDTVTPRAETASVDELRDTGLLMVPLIPNRTIVQEARTARSWYGDYRKGRPVVDAYTEITRKVLSA
ncbi:hypothetical protein GCM10009791_26810 [Citricoccus zhacaiensis]